MRGNFFRYNKHRAEEPTILRGSLGHVWWFLWRVLRQGVPKTVSNLCGSCGGVTGSIFPVLIRAIGCWFMVQESDSFKNRQGLNVICSSSILPTYLCNRCPTPPTEIKCNLNCIIHSISENKLMANENFSSFFLPNRKIEHEAGEARAIV